MIENQGDERETQLFGRQSTPTETLRRHTNTEQLSIAQTEWRRIFTQRTETVRKFRVHIGKQTYLEQIKERINPGETR